MAGRVLITGISGFTGPYLARELQSQGYEVHGLGRGEIDIPGVSCHHADLRDPQQTDLLVEAIRPQAVVHLAAIAFVGHSDLADMYLSNVVGTRNLLSALAGLETPPRRVVLASSANIYGITGVDTLDEEQPYNPQNDYAVSKCAMEMMAALWRDRLSLTIARPFNYTGVGQSRSFLIPKIVDHYVRGERLIELGNTDVYRDFSDVRVVAGTYAALLDESTAAGTYNICSGVEHSLDYVLQTVGEIAGYRIEVQVNPAFVRANEIRHLKGSRQRLDRAVGELAPIPLRDTLEWMYRAG